MHGDAVILFIVINMYDFISKIINSLFDTVPTLLYVR